MKDIRIGNDLNVAWSILKEGAPYNLEGLATKLYLKDMYGKKAQTFSVEGNVVFWRFKGADQKHVGKYSLELVINEGDLSMITTDSCNFVNLVFCDCKSEPIEDIAISSELGFVSIIVDSMLKEDSENAVANKAVVEGLKLKADKTDVEIAIGKEISQEKKERFLADAEINTRISNEKMQRENEDRVLATSVQELQHKYNTFYDILVQSPMMKINLVDYAYLDFAILG